MRQQKLIILLLLAGGTLIAFSPVLKSGFVNFDDPIYVTGNDHVRSGISPQTVSWSFQTFYESNWHPLVWLSHSLDVSLFGMDARFHHAMNLLLHLIGTILLFLALERMTGALWPSAFVAFVFAIHPLHVESVAWISARKDVLSGVFWMLSLIAYVRYARDHSRWSFILALALCAAGLMAKPVLVTLPFVFLLLDYWPLRRMQASPGSGGEGLSLRTLVVEKIPFFILAVISSVVTYIAQNQGGSVAPSTALPVSLRIANAIVSYALYIAKTFVPTGLAIFYPHPGPWIRMGDVAAALLLLTVITAIAWDLRKSRPYLLVGWLWFVGTLVPMSGLVQVGQQAMADRYMYIPLIGLSIACAWGARDLLGKSRIGRTIVSVGFALCVVLMIYGTESVSRYWKDSVSLFSHALAVTSGNYVAQNSLGLALSDSGRYVEAIPRFREAIRLAPDELRPHGNLARTLATIGRRRDAIAEYEWILARVPSDAHSHILLASLLADEGRLDESKSHLREAAAYDSTGVTGLTQLAHIYADQGDLQNATEASERILRIDPQNSKAHEIQGIVAGRQGRTNDAIREFVRAIQLDSTDADAYFDLGILYDNMGKKDDAVTLYQSALQANPSHWNAHLNLGTALARSGQMADAEQHWRRASELNPDAVDPRVNLGRLYAMQGKRIEAMNQLDVALRSDSNNVLAHFLMGQLLSGVGKTEAAEYHYNAVLRVAPNYQPAQDSLQKMQGRIKVAKGSSK